MILCFFLTALKQVNAVAVATISIIHAQKHVFLILQKTLTLEYSTQCQDLMKQDTQNGMKLVSVNVDLTVEFVLINNVGMTINVSVNANN